MWNPALEVSTTEGIISVRSKLRRVRAEGLIGGSPNDDASNEHKENTIENLERLFDQALHIASPLEVALGIPKKKNYPRATLVGKFILVP